MSCDLLGQAGQMVQAESLVFCPKHVFFFFPLLLPDATTDHASYFLFPVKPKANALRQVLEPEDDPGDCEREQECWPSQVEPHLLRVLYSDPALAADTNQAGSGCLHGEGCHAYLQPEMRTESLQSVQPFRDTWLLRTQRNAVLTRGGKVSKQTGSDDFAMDLGEKLLWSLAFLVKATAVGISQTSIETVVADFRVVVI